MDAQVGVGGTAAAGTQAPPARLHTARSSSTSSRAAPASPLMLRGSRCSSESRWTREETPRRRRTIDWLRPATRGLGRTPSPLPRASSSADGASALCCRHWAMMSLPGAGRWGGAQPWPFTRRPAKPQAAGIGTQQCTTSGLAAPRLLAHSTHW